MLTADVIRSSTNAFFASPWEYLGVSRFNTPNESVPVIHVEA